MWGYDKDSVLLLSQNTLLSFLPILKAYIIVFTTQAITVCEEHSSSFHSMKKFAVDGYISRLFSVCS